MKSPRPDELTEKYGSLMLGMLAPLRRVDVAATQAGIEYSAIAESAWHELLADYPAARHDSDAFSTRPVVAALNGILCGPSSSATREDDVPDDMVLCLAGWLEGTSRALQAIDPQAIEIACLLTEGFSHRAISEGLDIGLRLVNRVVEDIRCSPVAEVEAKASTAGIPQDGEVAAC